MKKVNLLLMLIAIRCLLCCLIYDMQRDETLIVLIQSEKWNYECFMNVGS